MQPIPKVIERCDSMNISEGNAIFYITDSSIIVKNEERDYNGLRYIGVYNSSL